MKNNIILTLGLMLSLFTVSSCSEEPISSQSEIYNNIVVATEFDQWLAVNFLEKYNIDIRYRMDDKLADMSFNLAPADYRQSILMAKMVKYLALEPYDDITGSSDFIKSYFPKIIQFIGSGAYQEGSEILGTAEGGKMMTLYNVNTIDGYINKKDIASLIDRYFHTVHHEFAHILHQTVPYPTEYNQITESLYVGDACFEKYTTDESAQLVGFITPYSATNSDEDFVEMLSTYATVTAEEWEKKLAAGGEVGRPLLETKIEILKNYMSSIWDIDMDDLRANVLGRTNDVFDNIDEDISVSAQAVSRATQQNHSYRTNYVQLIEPSHMGHGCSCSHHHK